MINHAGQIVPAVLIDELLRLYRADPEWVRFERLEPPMYRAYAAVPTWLSQISQSGADWFGQWALSWWLGQGPKIARPTAGQCEALEQVAVNLEVAEYSQPYPALLVDLPDGDRYTPFTSALCHHMPKHGLLTCSLFTRGNADDIVTTIALDGREIEESLQRFDPDCQVLAKKAARVLRTALNTCLAMTHFDFRSEYLLPKEVESDRRLAREASPRGERARKRLSLSLTLVSFVREVQLESRHSTDGLPMERGPGGEKCCHWRRGHWRSQPCGPGLTDRRRVFLAPVMVRADKFTGGDERTTTIYCG